MVEENPCVGVVVPVRNAARWLDEMLASLRAQTYQEWRAVVVDDGSDDESREIAERHQRDDPRIRAARSPGKGRGAPLTRAYGRSLIGNSAVLLYFPDGDDLLAPDLIARLVTRLQSDSSAVAAFCRYAKIDETGQAIDESPPPRIAMSRHWVRRLPDDEAITPFESIYGWAAPASEAVTMVRAKTYDEVGGWEAWPHQGGESIDLLCRMALLGTILFEPRPLYRYRRHSGQHTRDVDRYWKAPHETRETWQRRAELDPSLLPTVTRAEFFVEHRLIPRTGLAAARRYATNGRLLVASRFFIGAARRYRWRAFPETSST
jgi:glycosyltransferase involved in cell wall biosynthesis